MRREDGAGGFASATVTLHNAAPTAQNDSLHPPTGLAPFLIDVLANDSDPDLDTLTITAVTNGAYGTVSTDGATVRIDERNGQVHRVHGRPFVRERADGRTYRVGNGGFSLRSRSG